MILFTLIWIELLSTKHDAMPDQTILFQFKAIIILEIWRNEGSLMTICKINRVEWWINPAFCKQSMWLENNMWVGMANYLCADELRTADGSKHKHNTWSSS